MKQKRLFALILTITMLFGSISDIFMLSSKGENIETAISSQKEGMVAYMSFEEDTIEGDTLLDKSEGSNHGTIVGNVSFVDGVMGNAVLITNESNPGSDTLAGNSYINFGQPEDLQFGTNDFSIAFWMKSIGGGQNNSAIISNKNYANGGNIGFALGNFNNVSNRDNRMNFATQQGNRREINNISANDDQWHHIAATFDRSGFMMVYLDGTMFAKLDISSQTGSIDTGLDLVLGAGGNKRNALKNILVDELYIYNQAITPSVVNSLYYEVRAMTELDENLQTLRNIIPGSAYSESGLQSAIQTIEQAKQELEELSSEEKVQLMERTNQEYHQFLTTIKGVPTASFFAVSDIHLKTATDNRTLDFIAGLEDMKQIDSNASAWIAAGDHTGSGTVSQVNTFYNIMEEHRPLDSSKVLIALGNHEVRDGSEIWTNDPKLPTPYYDQTAKNLYLTKNSIFAPEMDGKVYYDKWLDGYHFIVLNTEKGLKDSTYLSPEQLIWFEQKLGEGANYDKPIFVINHQSLNDTHWRSNILNGFGTEDAKMKEILAKYPQTIFLSGHIHNGFGVAEIQNRSFGTMVEIPSYSESENGVIDSGTGYYVMIFEDEILFRARNFKTSTWLPKYDIQSTRNTLPVLYQKGSKIELGEEVEHRDEIQEILTQTELIFSSRYDQSVITGWNDLRPPAKKLFERETYYEMNQLSKALEEYLETVDLDNTVYSVLRRKWRDYLLGGSFDSDNPAALRYIQSLNAKTILYWEDMHKSTEINRSLLWDDLDMSFISGTGDLAKDHSGNISTTYYRLRDLAIAYSTSGTDLYGNEQLKEELVVALDYMYENYFNESDQNTPFFGNWWHWEIGSATASLNTAIILYDDLTPQQIRNYTSAVNRFSPVADRPSGYPGSPAMTGANLIDKGTAVALSGILSENSEKLAHVKSAFKTVFTYVNMGDGFYEDGSFIQHQALSYMGGYGSGLYEKLSLFFVVFKDSNWEIAYEDGAEQLAFDMIFKGIEPFFYNGLFMDMVSGRDITRKEKDDKIRGVGLLSAIIPMSDGISSPEMKQRFDRMIKHMVGADTEFFYGNSTNITAVMKAYEIMEDDSIQPRSEYVINQLFPSMDKLVYSTSDYTLGLSMHSNRTYGHELINSEGKRTWNIADGMTYLYTNDLEQYQNGYWATVDPTRLSGTTVEHKIFPNGSGDRQKNLYSWVGGSNIGSVGTAGMHYKAHGTGSSPRNGADVKKSWFFFGEEIVAIGSGITSNTENTVETIIDNRQIKVEPTNRFMVDGVLKNIVTTDSTAEELINPTWMHLEGNVEGADIGYYFPSNNTVNALYETRTGNWSAQGTSEGEERGSFATFWFDHGSKPSNTSYEYVILPNKSSIETAAYALENDITIIKNTPEVHGVQKSSAGVTAVNFWTANGESVSGISANQPASVTVENKDGIIKIAVSDPTQQATQPIEVTVAVPCKEVIRKDGNISLIESENYIKISVDTNGLMGKSSVIELKIDENPNLAVVEVSKISSIQVPFRTDFSNLPLPQRIQVLGNDLNYHMVDVKWNQGNYNRNLYGIYSIFGTLLLPDGFTNPTGKEAHIMVQVGEISSSVLQNAYVRGGTYANINYKGEAILTIKNDGNSISYVRKALLEFDITKVPANADRIYFEFQLAGVPSANFTRMNLYQVENGWVEDTITFQSFPRRVSDVPIGVLTKNDITTNGLQQKIDITEAVKRGRGQGLSRISIELSNPTPAVNDYTAVYSSYATDPDVWKPALSWERVDLEGMEEVERLETTLQVADAINPDDFTNLNEDELRLIMEEAREALGNPNVTSEELLEIEVRIHRILVKLRKKPVPKN